MKQEIGLSIEEMLKLSVFSNTKILGGLPGLTNVVSNVNVMEVPDILDWTRPGELLLTTGYSIRDNASAQERLIPSLAERKLAGLAIKPKRYISKIPDIMIQQANTYNFPLLELPYEVSFSDLMNPVLEAILDKQNNYLNRTLNAHQAFMNIILAGGNLKQMAEKLSQLINNTIVIYDMLHEEMACGTQTCQEEEVLELFKLSTSSPESQPLPFKEIQIPILYGNENYGKVIIYETDKAVTKADTLITEQLATAAALKIINQHALIQLERRYANEFLDLLLFSNITNEEDFINRGKFLGWDLSKQYVAVILRYEHKMNNEAGIEETEKQRIEVNNKIYQKCVDYLNRTGKAFIIGTKSDLLVLLLEIKQRTEKKVYAEILNEMKTFREDLYYVVRDGLLTIGIGRHYLGINGIQKSYREAIKALRIGDQTGLKGKDIHFGDLGIFRILALIENKNDFEEFIDETLRPLIDYDQRKKSDLLKTLEMFIYCQGNTRKVAESLYTHYNTVLYRIERIKKITKLDLENSEDRLKLEVALKINKFLNK